MKKFNLAWLFIVPAIVLTFNFFFVKNKGEFFMNWTDPSYAYLFNGMNLADGSMEVGHIDHPGTTVQIAAAFFIKIIHTVAGKNPDLVTDVLSDPERYLHILSFIFVLISSLILFYMGYVVKRVSNNIALAVFIQSVILVSFTSLTCMADLRPEPFLIFGMFLFVAVCFSFIHEKQITRKQMFGYSLKFGALCAFLVVTKITAIPLVILPLFLLGKWQSWLLYMLSFLFFAVLFLIPALEKMHYIFEWITRLFNHSGIYGQGEEEIINVSFFKENLWYIFRDDILFAISCLLMFSTLVVMIIKGKFRFSVWKNDMHLRLLTGIFLVTLICILIVAKHFKFHYLVPGYGLMMLGAYVSFRVLFSSTDRLFRVVRNKKIQIAGVSGIVILCSFNDFNKYYFYKDLENPKQETAKVMAKYKNVPRLYMTYEFYFAESPPAIYFASCYAGDTRDGYFKKLNEIYPLANFYSIPEKRFHKWETNSTFELRDFINQNEKILVSFYFTDSTIIRESLLMFRQFNAGQKVVDIKQVYVNPVSGEQLYELNRLSEIKENLDSLVKISWNVENILDGKLVSTDESNYVQGIEMMTNKEAHSGKNALELTTVNQYGFGFDADAKKYKHFKISAWRKSENGKGVLVANGSNGKFYRASTNVVEKGENGWEKITLEFDIPADYSDDMIKIFVFGENSDQPIYFDDLDIAQY